MLIIDLQDNIFSCENTEENTSGGIWNSVKGVVKNAFINLQSEYEQISILHYYFAFAF